MKLRIDIHTGHASPWSGEFEQDEITIGRAEHADVRLHPTQDTAVTRGIHARIVCGDDGASLVVEHESGITQLDGRHQAIGHFGAGERIPFDQHIRFEIGRGGPQVSAELVGEELPFTNLRAHGGGASLPIGRVDADVVHKARRAPRNVAIVAAVVIVLALAGAIIAMQLQSSTKKAVDQSQEAVSETRRLSEALSEVDLSFSAAEARRQEEIEELRTQYGEIDEALRSTIETKLREHAPAVFAVGAVDDQSRYSHAGTAWLAQRTPNEPARLATNAHVAHQLQQQQRAGLKVVARSWSDRRDYEVAVDATHPGFEAWLIGISEKGLVATADGFEQIGRVGACDAALLEVLEELPADITPLPLADDERLFAAEPGDEIGYVGFPSENVAMRVAESGPIIDVGRATRVTDFFGRADAEADVLEHTLVIQGGSSGSPLMNSDGEVIGIINSGSMVQSLGGRIPIGLNYAHHVRFVEELLEETADAEQAARQVEWETTWSQVLLSGDQLADHLVSVAERSWSEQALRQVRLRQVAARTLRIGDTGVETVTVDLPEANRQYFFLAAESTGRDPIRLTVPEDRNEGGLWARRRQQTSASSTPNALTNIRTAGPADVEISTASQGRSITRVLLRVYRVDVP